MNAADVSKALEPYKARLDSLGVERLLLVGSVARGEAGPDSDVDMVVEFRGKARFLPYMELVDILEMALRRPVDLTTSKALRPEIAAEVLAEARQVA